MRSAQQVHTLLKASRRSSKLLQKAERGRQLTHQLRSLLPSPLANYCQAGELHGHVLTIAVASPVWAAKLRYLLPKLLKDFASHPQLSQVTDVTIKISKLHQQRQPTPPGRKMQMSNESAEHIRQAANSIEDPALRESLLRLSRNVTPTDETSE